MRKTIFLFTIRQFLARPVRILLVTIIFLFPLIVDCVVLCSSYFDWTPDMDSTCIVSILSIIIGAGIIGSDVNDGILPLTFARPIKRVEYVVFKWLAVSTMASTIAIFNDLIHWLICSQGSLDLIQSIEPAIFLTTISGALGTTAIMLLFSCIVSGIGDAGLLLFSTLIAEIPLIIEEFWNVPWLHAYSNILLSILSPQLKSSRLTGTYEAIQEFGFYLSILFTALFLAVYLINRKELSYGRE